MNTHKLKSSQQNLLQDLPQLDEMVIHPHQENHPLLNINPNCLHIINGKLIIPHTYIMNKLNARLSDFNLIFNKFTSVYYNGLTKHISSESVITKMNVNNKEIFFLTPEQAYLLISTIDSKTQEKIIEKLNNNEFKLQEQQYLIGEIVKLKFELINEIQTYARLVI